MKKTDAIILAGTKSYTKFTIGKTKEHKQYLKIAGKYILKYTVEATLKATRVRNIFIVCDPDKIDTVLQGYSYEQKKRICIIPNKATLMENIHICFKTYTKSGILLPSDTPFLQAKDIDEFIAAIKPKTDYAIGFTDGAELDAMLEKIALYVNKERIKYGLFPIHDATIRINNLHYIDFTKITNAEIFLAQVIYDNRKLLNQHGKKNMQNWIIISYACFRYIRLRDYNPAILLGAFLTIINAFLFYLAHKYRHSKLVRFYTFPLRIKNITTVLWLLFGCKFNIQIVLTKNLRPMLDIDQEESYLLWQKNKGYCFREMHALLK